MNLTTIAHALVFTAIVHAAAIGCALVMVTHKEASGFIKGAMGAGVAFSFLSVLVVFWALASRTDSVASKISLLVLLHLVEFFVTGAGTVLGIVRPGHKINSPINEGPIIDPKDIEAVYKLRNGKATAGLTGLGAAIVIIFLLCFVLLVATDSLKKMKVARELPPLTLWSVACGDGPDVDPDYGEDAEYTRKSNKKPTFKNRPAPARQERYSSDESLSEESSEEAAGDRARLLNSSSRAKRAQVIV